MHVFMCYHCPTHPRMVCIFILCLSVWLFLGLVGKATPPPIYLHPPSGVVDICPLDFFCKVLHTLDNSFCWLLIRVWFRNFLEDSIPFLRAFFSMSLTFLEGVPKWSAKISNCYRASWLFCPVRYPQGYPLLSLGLQLSDQSSASASFGLLIIPKLPIILGVLWSYHKDYSLTASNVTGNLLPAFCFPFLVM